MRVAVLAENARQGNAVGNHITEIARFFQDRGSELQVFLEDATLLHPALATIATTVRSETVPTYLSQCDLIFATYAGDYRLLQWLPLLAGTGPRIVFDYLGVTPAELWAGTNRDRLERDARSRGHVWFADHALTMSQANRAELFNATSFPAAHTTTMPLCVDTSRFFPEGPKGEGAKTLLFVGRLAGNKCVPMLIQALARLDSGYHGLIVGNISDVYATEAARCQELARDLGVANRVRFVGSVDDRELPRYYQAADLLVMPSLHEGFCVPVIEAQASGLPVVAARATALPETAGDAGLTFRPNDVDDLVRQIRRVFERAQPTSCPSLSASEGPSGALRWRSGSEIKRIAIACFRYGSEIVGGAETSLRIIATQLRQAGHHVEVFTTRTQSENRWANDLPAGMTLIDGIPVHRFSIETNVPRTRDPSLDEGERYLRDSIHSTSLVNALRQRADEFDAVITGPYLFGLTADIAQAFSDKILLLPCFHDEPTARLSCWPSAFGNVGGLLFHSEEEQNFTQAQLGINHPNATVIDTVLRSTSDRPSLSGSEGPSDVLRCRSGSDGLPYVVYCGRYSEHKNLPTLFDWMRQFQVTHPGQLDLVLMGAGETAVPNESWIRNLGQVDEATKHKVLGSARALVQLSTNESLSLVALEAWAEATPVIAHRDCAVLVGQIGRAAGGTVAGDADEFAQQLNELLKNPGAWHQRGENGKRYVHARYTDSDCFTARILAAIDHLHIPLRQQLIERGIQRAKRFSRQAWQERFAEFVDHMLTQPARSTTERLRVEPLRDEIVAAIGSSTVLAPIRVVNEGDRAASNKGSGRTVICCEVDDGDGRNIVARREHAIAEMLQPGQAIVLPIPIAQPSPVGRYRVRLWCERNGTEALISGEANIALVISVAGPAANETPAATFLDVVRRALPRAHQACVLPSDYIDVTEGVLAPVKRFIKKKVLHNFKHAYVDALSRQQSKVNSDLVLMVQQLSECCTMLDQAIVGLHRRLDGIEAKLAEKTHHRDHGEHRELHEEEEEVILRESCGI